MQRQGIGVKGPRFLQPSDTYLASRGWTIPWRDGHAQLSVLPIASNRVLSVRVDGIEVARLNRPTLGSPWAECVVPNSPIRVVQIAYPHGRYRTTAFVNGICVEDSRTDAQWSATAPAAMDSFEGLFGTSRWFSPLGGLWFGLLFSLAFLAESSGVAAMTRLVGAVSLFILPFVWVMFNVGVIRWLIPRRSWPNGLRRLIVILTFLGVPLLGILVAQAITTAPK